MIQCLYCKGLRRLSASQGGPGSEQCGCLRDTRRHVALHQVDGHTGKCHVDEYAAAGEYDSGKSSPVQVS